MSKSRIDDLPPLFGRGLVKFLSFDLVAPDVKKFHANETQNIGSAEASEHPVALVV